MSRLGLYIVPFGLFCSEHTLGKSACAVGTLGVPVCVFASCVCIHVLTTLSVTLLPVELRNRRLEEARRCFVQSWSQDQKGTNE